MRPIDEALELAREYLQSGMLPEAEAQCRAVIDTAPDEPEGFRLLGIIAATTGQNELAEQAHRRAVELAPLNAEYRHNLSVALFNLQRYEEVAALAVEVRTQRPDLAEASTILGHARLYQGRFAEATEAYRAALVRRPDCVQTLLNLANALEQQGELAEAEVFYRRLLAMPAPLVEAAYNLANLLQRSERLDEAESLYRLALEIRPDYAEALNNYGSLLMKLRRGGESEQALRRAVELRPMHANAWNNLGTLYNSQFRPHDAIVAYRKAVEIEPLHHEAWSNLGNALQAVGATSEAIDALQRAVAIAPNYADGWYNLGTGLEHLMRYAEAEPALRRAIELQPNHTMAHNNLGKVFQNLGLVQPALAEFYQSAKCDPSFVIAGDNILACLQYRPGITAAELKQAHDRWNEQYARLLAPHVPLPRRTCRDNRLRIGFLSSDFGLHTVTRFFLPMFAALDKNRCTTICYSDRLDEDLLTANVRQVADEWVRVKQLNDKQLAERIRRDELDVLIDLTGHTSTNRLLVFARRCAPLQVTWLGYEGTTGLSEMDLLIADRFVIPPGQEIHYTERVVRMPHGYVSYLPPPWNPPVSELSAISRGHFTFGSFSNPAKLNAEVIRIWGEIMRRVPTARLVLMYRYLGHSPLRERLLAELAAVGVESRRVELRGWSPVSQFYATYGEIDVTLDPWPFNGGATTCDSLWMGVPVVTCPGETFASRHSLSHLSNIGLTETIVSSLDEYVANAIELAHDWSRVAVMRRQLRERFRSSPLCDGPAFAEAWLDLIESALKNTS